MSVNILHYEAGIKNMHIFLKVVSTKSRFITVIEPNWAVICLNVDVNFLDDHFHAEMLPMTLRKATFDTGTFSFKIPIDVPQLDRSLFNCRFVFLHGRSMIHGPFDMSLKIFSTILGKYLLFIRCLFRNCFSTWTWLFSRIVKNKLVLLNLSSLAYTGIIGYKLAC